MQKAFNGKAPHELLRVPHTHRCAAAVAVASLADVPAGAAAAVTPSDFSPAKARARAQDSANARASPSSVRDTGGGAVSGDGCCGSRAVVAGTARTAAPVAR